MGLLIDATLGERIRFYRQQAGLTRRFTHCLRQRYGVRCRMP